MSDTAAVRWADDPADGLAHALHPADGLAATARGDTEALCGARLPAVVTTHDRPRGAVCLLCVAGAAEHLLDTFPTTLITGPGRSALG